jgi:hypothetical protein
MSGMWVRVIVIPEGTTPDWDAAVACLRVEGFEDKWGDEPEDVIGELRTILERPFMHGVHSGVHAGERFFLFVRQDYEETRPATLYWQLQETGALAAAGFEELSTWGASDDLKVLP